MGSKICKGKQEEEIVEIDECFPMQEKTEALDWNDVRAVHYRCAANCLHNYALGKIVEKDFPPPRPDQTRTRKVHSPVRFADKIEESIPAPSYPADIEAEGDCDQDQQSETAKASVHLNGSHRNAL